MKKQISLLLVAVALNLSNGAQASFYSTAARTTRQVAPSILRATRPSGLSQSVINSARQFGTKSPNIFSTPMRQFSSQSTGKLTPEIVARPNYSYWQSLKDSPTARWMAGLLAGGTLIGTSSALAEEENQPQQVGWFERWFGKPRGYSHGKLQEKLWEIMNDKNEKTLYQKDVIPRLQNLMDQGLDLAHAKNHNGVSILGLFILAKDIEPVKFALEHGANPNEKNGYYGMPILYGALQNYNNPEILKLLLEHGADPNQKDYQGRPVLFEAIGNSKNPEHLKLLLEHGAHINATDINGMTALEYAKKVRPEVVPILKQYGKMGDAELSPTVRYISEWYKSK